MSAASHKWRILSRRCGELTAGLEVILPADAPAPARLTSRLGFLTSEWRRRHAAPPSRPFPCETVAEIVVGVSAIIFDYGRITGRMTSRPACSSGRAGAPAYLPPSPLFRVSDSPPAVSLRGQLTRFAPPQASPRLSGASSSI